MNADKPHSRAWLAGLAIVLLAATVRLTNIQWDQNHFFHPDERAVVSAVQRITFRPLNLDPDWFNYGTLPIYLTKIASTVISFVDPGAGTYDGIIVSGRRLSAIIGALTVLVLIGLGRRLYGTQAGLLAGLLLAGCVLHVQNSRFLTVDVTLTFFVLLAMTQLVRLCEDGRPSRYIGAGLCIGLALATKFSAAPLFLPLGIAALFRARADGNLPRAIGWTTLAVLAAIAAFAAAEPYALLNYERFYRDIHEQSVMVRNAGAYPYTTQYMHLPKYWYEIEQLVLWCMAPPLGLAAVWATASRPLTAWRSSRAAEWVLLSWVVPFFLVTGWFEVKFPRYLLPIYPIMILWAADAMLRLQRRRRLLGRLVIGVVVAGTLASTAAFVSTYSRDHTVVSASRWAYQHIPRGSKILTQDWDEGFPMGLPEGNAGAYTVVDFGYYGPDSSAKMQKLAQELATGDYIVFQTKRLYGATTRAPERFPQTNLYFYKLFAGDLGYTLIHEIASRPSLFGFEIPDELADESLSVYDHPKVLVFQNTGRMAADVLLDKILNGMPSRPLTRNDLLVAKPAIDGAWEQGGGVPPVRSSLWAFFLFAGLVELLGLAAFFVLRAWLPTAGAYALAKPLGVLLFAYVSWILVSLGVASFTQGTLLAVATGLVLLGYARRNCRSDEDVSTGEVVVTELVFWGALLFFLIVRAYNPEVFWGEKPMDFSFLNAMHRMTALPPPEPWFAGSPLHYSYFGYYVVAALGKAAHIHPALTFNLGIGVTAGLATAAAFAVGTAITQRWSVGVLSATMAILIGNLAGPGEAYARKVIDFHYFWATSRVIRDTINEYPLWSFLFADLHAHLLVMPITLSFMTLAVIWIRARILTPGPRSAATGIALLLLLGLTLGTIVVTNTWSTPTYLTFLPFLIGTVWASEAAKPGFFGFFGGLLGRVLLPAVAVAGLAYLLFTPYWAHFVPPERNFGWELVNKAKPTDFLLIFGLFLYILVPFVVALWARSLRRADGTWGRLRGMVILAAIGLVVAAPFVSTRAALAVMFVFSFSTLLAPSTPRAWRVPLAMAAFAFAVTTGTDVVWVWDRMNTIFKFYLESWFMFSISAAVAATALWSGRVSLGRLRLLWKIGLVGLLGVAVFTGLSAVYGVITTNRVPTPKPTLDGMAYLRDRSPHELAAFDWLNERIPGIPVLLEAHGDSYGDFTRVSMNTGLPTVLGWGYHVFQRAHPWSEINLRKADIETAYTSDNREVVGAILERYHVALVFVGGVERRTHAGGNLDRFNEWKDLLTPVYQNDGVTVFAVNGRFRGALPVSTIESVASVAGAEAPAAQDAPGRLQQPRSLGVAANGDIYVSDFGNNRVQQFAPDLSFVRQWGKPGDLPSQFREPCGLEVAPNGEVLVADTWNHRIQAFSPEGKYLREWSVSFYGPRGVAAGPDGKVFVSDTGNNRLYRFSADGKQERQWGGPGDAIGSFVEAMGIAVSKDGTVHVCDNGNHRLQAFNADGEPAFHFEVVGWESKVYSEPDVAIDGDGRIWVTVPGEKEIRAYDRTGKVLRTIKHRQPAEVILDTPMGIAFDPSTGTLLVTDLDGRIVRLPKQQF